MLNILKITSYVILAVAIVFAGQFLISSFALDESLANLLDAPGAFDTYKEKANLAQHRNAGGESLLVKQAKAFALRINPPSQTSNASTSTKPKQTGKKPRQSTKTPIYTKFKVLGTVVNATKPQMSMALIDLPGTGQKWVFQGETVNRVVIDEVFEGRITIKDGAAISELAAVLPKSKIKQLLKTTATQDDAIANLTPAELVNMVKNKNAPVAKKVQEPVLTPEQQAEKATEVYNAMQEITKDKEGADEAEVERLNEIGDILKAFMLLDAKKESPDKK